MLTTLGSYELIANNMSQSLANTAKQPQVSADTAYYLANIGSVTSISDFVNNYRLFSYAMTAYGLTDMTYAKAFMTKVLTEGTSSNTAFANQLADPRYAAFAKAFDFADLGAQATQTTAATTGTTQAYVEQTMETNAGNQDQGVQLALYFQRKASSITNAYQILADPALLQVAQTALGIDPSTGAANIDAQASMFSNAINFADFQDPTKVQQFIERFAAMWQMTQDQNAANSGTSADPGIAMPTPIITGQTTPVSIDVSTLTTLQNLRLGR